MRLDDDERLILMVTRLNPLPLEHLKRFRELGIKTVTTIPYTSWHEIEPSPGVFNWDILDRQIDLLWSAGLKVLVGAYERAPYWMPEEQCIHHIPPYGLVERPDPVFGLSYRDIDPLNEEALDREAEFLYTICERLSSDGTQVMYGVPGAGDRVLPIHYGKPYTEQQCIDMVVKRQQIFASFSDELWVAWHPAMALGWTSPDGHTKEECGNEYIVPCIEAIMREFPDWTMNRIAYQYWTMSDWKIEPEGIKMWVGAEYCANVVKHARKLEEYSMWGLIMEHTDWQRDKRLPTEQDYKNTAIALEVLS